MDLNNMDAEEEVDSPIESSTDVIVDEEESVVEPTGYAAIAVVDGESELLIKWKAERDERIANLEAASKAKQEELEALAAKDLESWQSEFDKGVSERSRRNGEDEKAFVATRDETTPGNEWSRVAFLIDFNAKSKNVKDTSRIKSILIRLKADGLQGRVAA